MTFDLVNHFINLLAPFITLSKWNFVTYSYLLLYADDIVLGSTTEEGLQGSVQKLSAFCKEWDLKINVSRTIVIVLCHIYMHQEKEQ